MFENIGKKIVSEGIFERFPDLKPAVDKNYHSDQHAKLLLVGESNYFPDEWDETKSVFKDAEKWYKGKNVPLIPEEMKDKVSNWIGNYSTFNRLFNSMKTILDKVGHTYNENLSHELHEAAYYNYFLRPASEIKGKKSFRYYCKSLDKEISYIALCDIIKEISPDIVIFVGKYAFTEFEKMCKINNQTFATTKIEFVNHSSRPYSWYHKNGNGQQKFEKLLMENWVQ